MGPLGHVLQWLEQACVLVHRGGSRRLNGLMPALQCFGMLPLQQQRRKRRRTTKAMEATPQSNTDPYLTTVTTATSSLGYNPIQATAVLTRMAAATTQIFHFYLCAFLHQMCSSSLAMVVLLLLATSTTFFHQPVQAKVFATQMSSRVVQTQYGPVRGVLITLPNSHLHDVEAYLGLQYASLLDGDLRFMPPTSPMEKWDTIKVAMKFRPVCPQKLPDIETMQREIPIGRVEHFERLIPFLEDQAEECLNLNVYVPTARNETELLPVVVFIHGETYEIGTGNAYDGSVMAAFGHVIVVTLNYRLGVLGFMSTGDSNAPGNYALLDQVAALHWVRENIRVFGGDPNEVSLLGQGYGAAMINILMISPVAKGRNLFKRAIIQSGSALSTWAVSRDPLRYTMQLAESVNCSQFWGQSAQLVECFKDKPYEELVRLDIRAPKYYSAWAPVIDHRSVLPDDVRKLMQQPDSVFANTNLLLGVMKNEGFLYFSQSEIDTGVSENQMHRMLRTYVRNVYQWHRQKIYEILLHHYTDWEQPTDPEIIRDNLMELLGDGQYIAPLVDLSRIHAASKAETFAYSFSYPSRLETYPRWAGGVHGDDLTYVFGAPLTDGIDPFTSTFTRSEKMLAEAVLKYWCNFVHSGNPNLPTEQDSIHGGRVKNRFMELDWPLLDSEKQEFLHIGMRPIIRHHLRGSKIALWLDLIPKLHKSDDLDPIHHVLDDYDNATSFEASGTRQLDMKTLYPVPPLQPETPYAPPQPSTTTTSTTSTSTLPPTTTTTTTTVTHTSPKYKRAQRTTKRPGNPHSRRGSPTPSMTPTTTPMPQSSGFTAKDGTLSLSVTIAVGCSLLFLNILIFAGVYYQKDRMRNELKLRQRELEKEKEARVVDSDHLKSSTSPETDTNSSSMATPPIPPAIARHQIQPQVTTLPKHPIPVCPPQAPYNTLPRRSPRHSRSCDHAMHDGIIKHSSSADSGTEVNNHHGHHGHHGNPSTVV